MFWTYKKVFGRASHFLDVQQICPRSLACQIEFQIMLAESQRRFRAAIRRPKGAVARGIKFGRRPSVFRRRRRRRQGM